MRRMKRGTVCLSLLLVLASAAIGASLPAHAASLTWVIGPTDDANIWGYGTFSEGLAWIGINGKYGFIDKTGEVVIGAKFSDVGDFHDGLAPAQVNGKWGYIDKTGTMVIQPKDGLGEPFREGYAVGTDPSTNREMLIDTSGNIVLSGMYNVLDAVGEGLIPVETEDDKVGFKDISGAYVIDPTFDSALSFSEGLAPAKTLGGIFENTWGYIDRTGEFAFPAKFAIAHRFSDGLARVVDELPDGHTGFIDSAGAYVIPAQFDAADDFSEGLAPAELDGKWGYIDKEGNWVIEPQFLGAGCFGEGMASVMTASICGFIANPLGAPAPKDEPDSWATTEVNAAITAGLVPEELQSGYKTNITRADFCRLAVNLMVVYAGSPIDDILAGKGLTIDPAVFSDTQDETILAANALGIVGGRGSGIFDPGGSITRQEAAAMLMRAAKALGYTPAGQHQVFGDTAGLGQWAKDAIDYISAATDSTNGKAVMGGTAANTFSPLGTYTRQQAYLTMIRLFHALGSR